jgi:hypothetical protein
MQRIKKCGGTFSGWKMDICVPSIVVVGHRCTYEGRVPEDRKIKKILDWLACNSLTEVPGFLGVCGIVRTWVKDFSKKARPLVELTKNIMDFVWEEPQELAMAELKDAVAKAPCLHPIDYLSLLAVILVVDSSYIALGFIIYQMGADKKRYPNRFGSITWNDRESQYSLEIYGLWRALHTVWLHIIGVKNLVVEVDAQYIKGMLNNPDIQPNAAVNRWIGGIMLFDFTLIHVPTEKHAAADGMSRQRRVPEDSDEEDDEESTDDWLDKMMSFGVELVNSRPQFTAKSLVASGIPGHHVGVPYLAPRVGVTPSTAYAVYFGTQKDDEDETATIPLSTKALEDDERLHQIKMLLNDPLAYKDFGSKELINLVYQASKFFILDGSLMRRDRQGRHKVVPDPT